MKYGQQAYELRRRTILSWSKIADKIDYGQQMPQRLRGERMCLLARSYAENGKFQWPVKRPDPRSSEK